MSDTGFSENLVLESIIEWEIPGVTQAQARQHAEACLICLDKHQHLSGVIVKLVQQSPSEIVLRWNGTLNDRARRGWGDLQEATEYGATAIAILFVITKTEYTIIERAAKGDGFDYWLFEQEDWDEANFLQGSARLEVSGIMHAEKDSEIKSRVKQKKKQTEQSDDFNIPAVIVVVEFSRPEVHMVQRS